MCEKGVMWTGKGQEGGFLPLIALPLMIKTVSGNRLKRAGKGYNDMNHLKKNI